MLNDDAAQVVCCHLQTERHISIGTPGALPKKKIWNKSLNTASLKDESWENIIYICIYNLGLHINYASCPLQNPYTKARHGEIA